ncbi:MAG TPA: PTS fructose transporter subunit IIA [Nevskiaceae bacterium]|nr:PTS fructose transporter subunit IIA [Nevskiaceae bacterium]
MSVGILLVTHGRLGQLLLNTVSETMGALSLSTSVLEIRRVQSPDVLLRQGARLIEKLNTGQGVLILTDAFGSTPSNIATQLGATPQTQVIAGVNLPMLMRIYNYPALDLAAMTQNALEGGQRGVAICPPPEKK